MNPQSPRISVLVPAFNVENNLPSLIQAMGRQSLTDWELIIADDCSSDNTLSLAREYASSDPRIRVIARPTNSGTPLLPRLDACAAARADSVVPLDADDTISDNYLERLLQRVEETDADIILPMMINCRNRDSGGNHNSTDGKPIFREDMLDASRIYKGRDLVIHTLYEWDFGCNGALYRRRLYYEALTDLIRIPVPEDIPAPRHTASSTPYIDEVGTRALLLKASKVAFAPQARYFYMPNPTSVVETPRSLYMGIEADIWLRELIKSNFPPASDTSRRLDLHCGVHLAGLLGRFHRERNALSPQRREELRRLLRDAWRRLPRSSYRALSPAYALTLALGPRIASIIFGLAGK